MDCLLCRDPGGEIVWQDGSCRVVRVGGREALDYPGYCRVIWRAHVAEMTDLDLHDRRHLMAVVFATEAALRAVVGPDKVNVASLGNQVPHLHWHVIPRWRDDRNFPDAVWAPERRPAPTGRPAPAIAALHDAIVQNLAEEQGGTFA